MDDLHIHLIANRISINRTVVQTNFISNRASNTAKELYWKMGLTISKEVRWEKQHQKQKQTSTSKRLDAKQQLRDIAYGEFRNN
jgi:hypothetical protein